MDIQIVIDNNIFTYDTSDYVFTGICAFYNGKFFPSVGWNDFTDVLLRTWTHVMLEKRYTRNKTFELYFMDGDYRMIIHKDKDMQLTVNCVEDRGKREKLELSFKCGYFRFLESLYSATKSFNEILLSNNLTTGKYEPVFRQTILSMNELENAIKEGDNSKKHYMKRLKALIRKAFFRIKCLKYYLPRQHMKQFLMPGSFFVDEISNYMKKNGENGKENLWQCNIQKQSESGDRNEFIMDELRMNPAIEYIQQDYQLSLRGLERKTPTIKMLLI